MTTDLPRGRQPRGPGLPAGVWALGIVSLCMDTSSELVHSLLPVFLVTGLGASVTAIGVIEGVAEASAAFIKVGSGILSDRLKQRKWLVGLGYGMAAVAKPLFPLASSVGWVFAARFIDRVGKGIRGAPRDALVAELTPATLRGAAFGLRQALDSVGAFLGPLLAFLLMVALAGEIRAVLWVAVVPAALAVAVLILWVHDPAELSARRREAPRLRTAIRLSKHFWMIIVVGAVFTLARFSEAFLLLRAQELGLAARFAPLVFVAMNVVYAASAVPAGRAADRLPPRRLLLAGLAILIAADVLLAAAPAAPLVFVGAALWGLHLALTQGLFAKLVADAAPQAHRGAAFGVFHLTTGVALLLASVVAGILWNAMGPAATFLTGAVLAAAAAAGVPLLLGRAGERPSNHGDAK